MWNGQRWLRGAARAWLGRRAVCAAGGQGAQAVESRLRWVWAAHLHGQEAAAAWTTGPRDQKGTQRCMGRESNPGLPRGRREFYH